MIIGRYTVGRGSGRGAGRIRFRFPSPPFEAGKRYTDKETESRIDLVETPDGILSSGGGESRGSKYRYVIVPMLSKLWKPGDVYYVSGDSRHIIIERAK